MAQETKAQTEIDKLKSEAERVKIEAEIEASKQKIAEAKKAISQAEKDKIALEAPKEEKAKTPKEVAEEEKAIAEAKAATIKAATGFLDSAGSKLSLSNGSFTMDSNATMVEIGQLARKLSNLVTGEMTTNIINHIPKPSDSSKIAIAIYQEKDVNSIIAYKGIIEELTIFQAKCRNLEDFIDQTQTDSDDLIQGIPKAQLAPAALAIPSVITGVLKSAADIVQLFKTDIEVKGQTISVLESDVVALMRGKLDKYHIYYPKYYPAHFFNNTATSKLLTGIDDTNSLLFRIKTKIEKLKESKDAITTFISIKANSAKKTEGEKLIKDIDNSVTALNMCIEYQTKMNSSLIAIDAESKISYLSILNKAEKLYDLLLANNLYFLKLDVSATGNYRIKKTLWKNAKISYNAGIKLSYWLFDSDGNIICSDYLYESKPFTKAETY